MNKSSYHFRFTQPMRTKSYSEAVMARKGEASLVVYSASTIDFRLQGDHAGTAWSKSNKISKRNIKTAWVLGKEAIVPMTTNTILFLWYLVNRKSTIFYPFCFSGAFFFVGFLRGAFHRLKNCRDHLHHRHAGNQV